MNWFKHDTDATQDAKVKKLLIRYGAVGYAIYFHCLELIAAEVSETNLTFELEHDSEIIADNLHIKGTAERSGIEIVQEIMRYIVNLGLFTCSNDKIFCYKLLKRLDSSMTSNPTFRKMISEAKGNHDDIMTDHDSIMQASKQARIASNQEEQAITGNAPFEKVLIAWYQKFLETTCLTVQPSEEDRKAAAEAMKQLGNDEAVGIRAVAYYWNHWQDLWFAYKSSDRQKPPAQRKADYSFRGFARNITSCLVTEKAVEAVNDPF